MSYIDFHNPNPKHHHSYADVSFIQIHILGLYTGEILNKGQWSDISLREKALNNVKLPTFWTATPRVHRRTPTFWHSLVVAINFHSNSSVISHSSGSIGRCISSSIISVIRSSFISQEMLRCRRAWGINFVVRLRLRFLRLLWLWNRTVCQGYWGVFFRFRDSTRLAAISQNWGTDSRVLNSFGRTAVMPFSRWCIIMRWGWRWGRYALFIRWTVMGRVHVWSHDLRVWCGWGRWMMEELITWASFQGFLCTTVTVTIYLGLFTTCRWVQLAVLAHWADMLALHHSKLLMLYWQAFNLQNVK